MVLDDVYRSGEEPTGGARAGSGVSSPAAGAALGAGAGSAAGADAAAWAQRMALPIDRLAAAIADAVFFAPVATLCMAPLRRAALVAQLTANHSGWTLAAAGAFAAVAFALIAYHALFIAWLGATPGKRLFGLSVVSVWDDRKPKPGAALVRACAFAAEVALLGIPWLAIFANDRRRPLHDRIGDCAVVGGPGRGRAAAPSHFEAGVAAGIFAAVLATAAVVAASAWDDFARDLKEADAEARELEERGLLCQAAADLRAEWPEGERPSRLEAALALAAFAGIEPDCLGREADHEAWQNYDSRSLAYAAQAVAHRDEPAVAEKYAAKACARENSASDACLLARLASSAFDEKRGDMSPSADDALLSRASGAGGPAAPLYVRAFAIRRRLESRDYASALALLDDLPPRQGLASLAAGERAKALWALGRVPEARATWAASISSASASGRQELAGASCASELELGCSSEARRACGAFVGDIKVRHEPIADAESLVAFVRGDECATGLAWSPKPARALAATRDGRAYVDAVTRARLGDASGARKALRQLLNRSASAAGGDSDEALGLESAAIYFDAQARLAQMAPSIAEADEIWRDWEKAERGDAWSHLGRALVQRFLELGAPRKALSAGLLLRGSDPLNSALAQAIVVAAYRAGDPKLAADTLRSLDELAAPSTERSPASLADFDRIAQDLRARARGPGGLAVGKAAKAAGGGRAAESTTGDER
jgi:uncharacterized RDD family membrane protein YckC